MSHAAGEPAPTPTMHRLTVARTARYATVGAEHAQATQLWIAFHGYAHRASDFVTPLLDVVPSHVRVVAPEGLSRFYLEMPRPDGGHLARTGASWLTRDDRDDELRDALAMVQSVVAREYAGIVHARGERPALCVLGFSQGVAMSMRWVVEVGRNPAIGVHDHVHRHVLWAGGLAHDVSDEALRNAWRDTQVEVVWGSRDKFASESARETVRARFEGIGVTPAARTFEGGHRLDATLFGAMLREGAGRLSDRP